MVRLPCSINENNPCVLHHAENSGSSAFSTQASWWNRALVECFAHTGAHTIDRPPARSYIQQCKSTAALRRDEMIRTDAFRQ